MTEGFDLRQVQVKVQPSVDVPLATHDQVVQAGDDYFIIDAATCSMAKEINDIDNRLFIKYNRRQDFFVLFAKEETREGLVEYYVKSFTKLDPRIVERVKEISDPSYDFIKEGEQLEKEWDKEKMYAIEQRIGDTADRLAHALRKDLGVKSRAFFDGRSAKKLVSEGNNFLGGVRGKDA